MSGRGLGAKLLAAMLVVGCQQGGAGSLEPVAGQSVERGDEAGSAVVRAGAVSATVKARWAAEASQSADIVYRNDGNTPVLIILPHLRLHHQRLGDALLWAVSDMTNVDRDDARTDNDEAKIVYDKETAPETMRLLIEPGERRTLNVGFLNFPGTERIARGDRVTATVPLGARDRTIEMVAH